MNFKDGVIRDGSSPGSGRPLGNIKDGVVRDGSSPGSGRTIGKVTDFVIKGMEGQSHEDIILAYHFFVRKLF